MGLTVSVIILGIGLILSTLNHQPGQTSQSENDISWDRASTDLPTTSPATEMIIVDVSGAVHKPGMYEVSGSARLSEAVSLANGLTEQADKEYYYRNYNLAKKLEDQEKIYIPHRYEIQTGLFTENSRILRYDATEVERTNTEVDTSLQKTSQSLININTATSTELETLPGVGPVTAAKIIDNRPYTSIEELRDKNAVGESVYGSISDMISL